MIATKVMAGNIARSLPRVSVVMAAYNAERFLDEAINSIREQTFPDFELIVVDDCSKDSTPQKLAAHAAADDRIRVLRNSRNIRQVASLNRGILEARGEYVAIMDADDISAPTRLQAQVDHLDTHPEVGVVGCLTDAFVDDPRISRSSGARADGSWLDGNIMMAHPTMMVRKEIYFKHGLYDPKFDIIGDYEIQSRFGNAGVVMHVLDEIHLHYRVHDQSMTGSRRKEQVKACLGISMRTLLRYRRSLSLRGYKAMTRYLLIYVYLSLHLEKLVPRTLMKRLWPGF